MKSKILGLLVCGLLLAAAMAVPALAEDRPMPVVTGEHWTKSTPQERKAFLVGAATIIELDQEVQGKHPAKNSTIEAWSEGLSPYTFDQMVATIDKWYAGHPDQLKRPVVSVMWYEMAKPHCPVASLPTEVSEDVQTKAVKTKATHAKTKAKAGN